MAPIALIRQMIRDPSFKAAVEASMDRRIIRVELPPEHAGVTAALRRAFASAPAVQDNEHDFGDLLERLG